MQNIFPEKCNVGTFDHFSGIKELFSMFFDKESQRLLHSSIHSAEAASLGIRQSHVATTTILLLDRREDTNV